MSDSIPSLLYALQGSYIFPYRMILQRPFTIMTETSLEIKFNFSDFKHLTNSYTKHDNEGHQDVQNSSKDFKIDVNNMDNKIGNIPNDSSNIPNTSNNNFDVSSSNFSKDKYRGEIIIRKLPLEGVGLQYLDIDCVMKHEIYLFRHTEDKWILYCEKTNGKTILDPPITLSCDYNYIKKCWSIKSHQYRDINALFTLNTFGEGLGFWANIFGHKHIVEILNDKPEMHIYSLYNGKQIAYSKPLELFNSNDNMAQQYKKWEQYMQNYYNSSMKINNIKTNSDN